MAPGSWARAGGVGVLLLLLMMTTTAAIENTCEWMIDVNESCINRAACTETGLVAYIWEDCQTGSELFTVNDTMTIGDECQYLQYSDHKMSLATEEFDAEQLEGGNSLNCPNFIDGLQPLFFDVLNVNEFSPRPAEGTIFQIEPLEEEEPGVLTIITYTDEDVGETETLTSELITTEYADQFELTNEYNETSKAMIFTLKNKEILDFENMMYYSLQYNIMSTDERGDAITTEQTILIAVKDVSDNPPYWVKYYPSFSLDEGEAGREVFQVEARDRDVMIANDIRYFLSGDGTEYFSLDETAGILTTIKIIDREVLLTENIRSFTLDLMAVEYNGDQPVIPLSNSTQVSVISIIDINNKEPTFNQDSFNITIDELTQDDYTLLLSIFVVDMDEGLKGSFSIESSDPYNLEVSATSGSLNQSITLTAKYRGENNIFNYEIQEDEPMIFTITAVEEADNSHVGETTVIITLNDINDNHPVFTNNYEIEVPEMTEIGSSILMVSAEDDDVTPNFSTESIVYSLQECQKLEINNKTGNVTLISKLDFEAEGGETVECKVTATDEFGEGLAEESTITINVQDNVDETPKITIEAMEILENSAEDKIVGNVTVSDGDSGAKINITIDWAASGASIGGENVPLTVEMKAWFKMGEIESVGDGDYRSSVLVGGEAPDRETADTVTLHIIAIDGATEVGSGKDSGDAVISILDESDEDPIFFSECKGETVDENIPADTLVCTLEIGDPDADDMITLTVDDDSLVYLEVEKVNTTSGESVPIKILVQEGATIDREEMESFSFTVTLTDDENHITQSEITIGVNDKNDIKPKMIEGVCNSTQRIEENKEDGYEFFQVIAVDNDTAEPYNSVSYRLLNLNMPGDQNRLCPFNINSTTGNVMVDLSGGNTVDREQFDSWELFFQADDSCGQDTDCLVLSSDTCTVYVDVLDMNDHGQDNFDWTPHDDSIQVDEFMMKGDFAKRDENTFYQIFAEDGDEEGTLNVNLSYTVLATTKKGGSTDLGLFTAKNEIGVGEPQYYCLLQATQDFSGKQLKGEYEIHILTEDQGDPVRNGTDIIPLTINDANDNRPKYIFGGCLDNDSTIYVSENYYEPYQDLVCDTQRPNDEMSIEVEDDDDPPNNEVVVSIAYENSTQVVPEGAEGQLTLFQIGEKEGGGYRLYVTDNIDGEQGLEYNLSLHVVDKGEPPLSSSRMLRVIVENVGEYDPYFCEVGQCVQTLYMVENNAEVSANFQPATDLDNPDGLPPIEDVYYHIMDGDTGDFTLISSTQTTLQLSNKPGGLDRETKSNYTLYIVTSNTDERPPGDHDLSQNDTLKVTIQVQDKNDNAPFFSTQELFGSFMESDTLGNKIADIEATDLDLNETLTYTLGGIFQWNDADATPSEEEPFILSRVDDLSASLLLNFQPTGVNKGYCNFTIHVEDKGGHKSSMGMKVYAITADFLVVTYFYNSVAQLQSQQDYISTVFTQTLDYPCIIDSISSYEDSSKKRHSKSMETRSDNTTVETTMVYMHFIDPTKNEPVPVDIIVNLINNEQMVDQLMSQLGMAGLNLISVQTPPGSDKEQINDEDTILMLKILLGVVSLVLGLLVILLITVYFLRTRSLERKVKVLSTNTFGSQGSGLDEAGTGKVPGSNMFTGEGANPMYNMPELQLKGDNSSISSGDSVLVGVEDNPEFRGGKVGSDNPAFITTIRSIDHITATPSVLNGGSRTNPLLQLSSETPDDMDLSDGPQSLELKFQPPSVSGSEDSSPIPGSENFSFLKL